MTVAVPGLTLRENVISPGDEAAFLAEIDSLPWQDDLRRRVQHYGYRYDYKARAITSDMKLGPMPLCLGVLTRAVHLPAGFERVPDQLIVNEYEPGQGISAHIDCQTCFGPVVASITLGGGTVMTFKHRGTAVDMWLPPRSMLILSGPARWTWTHEIRPRRSDPDHGPRSRRVSLTFRTVVLA